jgi:hypothetical protein
MSDMIKIYGSRRQHLEFEIDRLSNFEEYLESIPLDRLIKQWERTCHSGRKLTASINTIVKEKLLRQGHTAGVIEGLKLIMYSPIIDQLTDKQFQELLENIIGNWRPTFFTIESITKTGE